MDTSVKWFHSGMQNARLLVSGNASSQGTLLNVLDDILVDGFNQQTVQSGTVNNGVATLTFAVPHGFLPFSVILVQGASDPAINGEKRVLSVPTSTTLTFTTTAANGPINGSVTALYAPAGWTRPFARSSNICAYRNSVSEGTGFFYRVVNDQSSSRHDIAIFQSMLNLSTGVQLVNLTSLYYGVAGNASSSYSHEWIAIANSRTVYFLISRITSATNTSMASGSIIMLGDAAPVSSADLWFGVLSHLNANNTDSIPNLGGNLEFCGAPSGGMFFAGRSYTGGFAGVALTHAMESFYSGTAGVSGGAGVGAVSAYPNAPDTSLILTRKVIFEGSHLRGFAPGLYVTPQNCAQQFSQAQIIDGQGALAGRKLMTVRCGNSPISAQPAPGVVFFDITGPWSYTP